MLKRFFHSLTIPFSWLFAFLVWLKNRAYEAGFFSVKRLEVPVISVGNLAMGGTGKTPVCAALAEKIQGWGGFPLILSRGYKRRNPKRSLVVDTGGAWQDFGDEPFLLARRLGSSGQVRVGPSRVEAAACAPIPSGAVALVDDGFQHRQLARDLDVVLVDGRKKPELFPRALFRESASSLARADLVFVTGLDPTESFPAWLKKSPPSNVPLVRTRFEPHQLIPLDGGPSEDLERLNGARVAAFCGIARPHRFTDTLGALGAEVVHTRFLRDHEPLSAGAWQRFVSESRRARAELILATEKDAVKFDLTGCPDILAFFLTIRAVFHPDAVVDEAIHQIVRR